MRFQFDLNYVLNLLLYGFDCIEQHLLRFLPVNLRVVHSYPFAICVHGIPVTDCRNVCRAQIRL